MILINIVIYLFTILLINVIITIQICMINTYNLIINLRLSMISFSYKVIQTPKI